MASPTPLYLVLRNPDDKSPWIIELKMFDILKAYLQQSSGTAADAANEIDRLFPLNRPTEGDKENEEPVSFLLEMWGLVINIAGQIPWNDPPQERLVDFLRALRDLPEPKVLELEKWGSFTLWSDLPLLSVEMVETGHGINLTDSSDAQKAIRLQQQNFVAFAARLTRTGLLNSSWSGYNALYYFRQALEQASNHPSPTYIDQLNVYAPLAAIWILIAGNVIFEHCRTPAVREDGQSSDRGTGFTGPEGFTLERWNFWRQKFREIAEHSGVCDETKVLVGEAEDSMRKITVKET